MSIYYPRRSAASLSTLVSRRVKGAGGLVRDEIILLEGDLISNRGQREELSNTRR